MTLRSLGLSLALAALPAAASVAQPGQVGLTVDEGTFAVTRRAAASGTESFKIARLDNGVYRATSQFVAGDVRTTSSLTTDSLGTPIGYRYVDRDHGVTTMDIQAQPRGRRLAITSSDNRHNESMREMPFTAGQCVLLDDVLVHQLFFAALGKRAGEVEVIDPRGARHDRYAIVGRGLETVQVGRRAVTATHYALTGGPVPRDFWVDDLGHLVRAEVPSVGLVAVREDLPR